jgi:hypothetical protein
VLNFGSCYVMLISMYLGLFVREYTRSDIHVQMLCTIVLGSKSHQVCEGERFVIERMFLM